MSRIPPGLLYLTIYNPTLHPDPSLSTDDEDAEEQAHILFYTARERAVSRDRMLRQVGLAKALINFSGMFNALDMCENVHTQSRRMVMVSPEPDFWIHACLEVAKTPRALTTKGKGKSRGSEAPTMYDYHDGSIYDLALKRHIMNGYEHFKLTHGSFSSILLNLGQQALELQLERFFTVWAWKWDVEGDIDFGGHLGVPLHPLHRSLNLLLDDYTQQLPACAISFALIPPYAIPSSRLLLLQYPDTLVRHILSKIPPLPPKQAENTSHGQQYDEDTSNKDPKDDTIPDDSKPSDHQRGAVNPFDMRNLKWMWNGLTFGKGPSTRPNTPGHMTAPNISHDSEAPSKPEINEVPEVKMGSVGESKQVTDMEVKIDADSLREAISSENAHSPAFRPSSALPSSSPRSSMALQAADVVTSKELDDENEEETVLQDELNESSPILEESREAGENSDGELRDTVAIPPDLVNPLQESASPPDPPSISTASIYLADTAAPTETRRKKVLHATIENVTIAFVVDENHGLDLVQLSEQLVGLFEDMQTRLKQDEEKRGLDSSLPSLSKILAPENKHIITSGAFTSTCTQPFTSKSEHLFRGQELLHSYQDITEVFSRGQNPQHWHVSRRSSGANFSEEPTFDEAYLEVARKESTLTDVDNELAGVIRRYGEHSIERTSP